MGWVGGVWIWLELEEEMFEEESVRIWECEGEGNMLLMGREEEEDGREEVLVVVEGIKMLYTLLDGKIILLEVEFMWGKGKWFL